MADGKEVVVTETTEENKGSAPSQEKTKRTEAETTAYNLKKQAEKAKELGLDPTEILGIKPKIEIDETLPEDTPLTVGTFKEMQKQDARKTALQMAESLDDSERDEVLKALERVVPSGNAEADFNFARSAANAERTHQVAQVAKNKGTATRTAAGGTTAGKAEDDFVPTDEELVFMQRPYNLTKEKIIARRSQS